MKFKFTLVGQTDLLMHADNVLAADELIAWRKDPKNKSVSKAGDDRSPAWTWQTYLHTDDEGLIAMPQTCIGTMLRQAGAEIILKKQTTYKSLTQSGILFADTHFPVMVSDKPATIDTADRVKWQAIDTALLADSIQELDFAGQAKAFEGMSDGGTKLHVCRAAVGMRKHIRVRPQFKRNRWSVSGIGVATDPALSLEILQELFSIGGRIKGLGDWRPSAKKSPGPFGQFEARVELLAA